MVVGLPPHCPSLNMYVRLSLRQALSQHYRQHSSHVIGSSRYLHNTCICIHDNGTEMRGTSPCFQKTYFVTQRGTLCLKRDAERNRSLHWSARHGRHELMSQNTTSQSSEGWEGRGGAAQLTACRSFANERAGRMGIYVL